jgi:outer membrane protein TolC
MSHHACARRKGLWSWKCAPLLVFAALAGMSPVRAQEPAVSRKLTLKEAVSLAVNNSRDLALARLQYGVAERQAGVDRSAFRPNFYTGSGAAYTSGFPLVQGGGAPTIFSLSFDQQLYNPPLKGEQHAAEQRAEAQRLGVDATRDTVMMRAALEYLELAKVRHSLDLMRGERLSAGHILDAMRERAEAGRELPIEVTRAELATARIEQRIAQMEDREDTLSNELRDMMGLPQDMQIEVAPEDIPADVRLHRPIQCHEQHQQLLNLFQQLQKKQRDLRHRGKNPDFRSAHGSRGGLCPSGPARRGAVPGE